MTTGISEACQIRVAKYLGQGDPEGAKQTAIRSICIVGFLTGFGAIAGLLLRGFISTTFAEDRTIIALMYDTLPIILFGTFAEGFGCAASYIIEGQGRFRLVSTTEVVQTLLVTIPLSSLMVFVLDFGVQGIASALIVGYLTSGTVLLSFVLISDWEKIAREYKPKEESLLDFGEEISLTVSMSSCSSDLSCCDSAGSTSSSASNNCARHACPGISV